LDNFYTKHKKHKKDKETNKKRKQTADTARIPDKRRKTTANATAANAAAASTAAAAANADAAVTAAAKEACAACKRHKTKGRHRFKCSICLLPLCTKADCRRQLDPKTTVCPKCHDENVNRTASSSSPSLRSRPTTATPKKPASSSSSKSRPTRKKPSSSSSSSSSQSRPTPKKPASSSSSSPAPSSSATKRRRTSKANWKPTDAELGTSGWKVQGRGTRQLLKTWGLRLNRQNCTTRTTEVTQVAFKVLPKPDLVDQHDPKKKQYGLYMWATRRIRRSKSTPPRECFICWLVCLPCVFAFAFFVCLHSFIVAFAAHACA
jgi:hypothetical protein